MGFVTNSSSTQHIIAWKGKEEDLLALLQKHSDIFPDYSWVYPSAEKEGITNESLINCLVECLDPRYADKDCGEGINSIIEFLKNCIKFDDGHDEEIINNIDKIAQMDFVANVSFGEVGRVCEEAILDFASDSCLYDGDEMIYVIVSHH